MVKVVKRFKLVKLVKLVKLAKLVKPVKLVKTGPPSADPPPGPAYRLAGAPKSVRRVGRCSERFDASRKKKTLFRRGPKRGSRRRGNGRWEKGGRSSAHGENKKVKQVIKKGSPR